MMKSYTIQELANEFNVPTDALIEKLKEKGIEATPDEKLVEIEVEIEYKYDLDREEFKAMLEEIIGELLGESG